MTTAILIGIVLLQMAVIVRFAVDSSYKILVRAALDLLYPVLSRTGYNFIVFDIDGLGEMNGKLGYDVADSIIRNSLRKFWRRLRIGDIIFRHYSGDEFSVAIYGDIDAAYVAACRAQETLAEFNICATYVVHSNPYTASTILAAMKPKGEVGERGQIKVVA